MLWASSGGLVSDKSSKQRAAAAISKHTAATAQASAQAAEQLRVANTLARTRAAADQKRDQQEHEFRYATDLVFRQWWDEKQVSEAEAKRLADVEFHQRLSERLRLERESELAAKLRKPVIRHHNAVIITWVWLFWLILPVAALLRITWLLQTAVATVPGLSPVGRPILVHRARQAWGWLWSAGLSERKFEVLKPEVPA